MRMRHRLAAMLTAVALLVGSQSNGTAAEYSFAPYGLGAAAFGAGVTPPPGTYNTAATAFYAADIAASIQFGGVSINAGAHVEGFSSGLNGGNLGLSVTVPVRHIASDATVVSAPLPPISRDVDGWGLGDVATRAQRGWQHGDFSHSGKAIRRSPQPPCTPAAPDSQSRLAGLLLEISTSVDDFGGRRARFSAQRTARRSIAARANSADFAKFKVRLPEVAKEIHHHPEEISGFGNYRTFVWCVTEVLKKATPARR